MMRPCLLLLSLLTLACRTQEPIPEEAPQDPNALLSRGLRPRAFPAAFQKPAVLVANRISIEGPTDLLEHVALRPDDDVFVYTTRTTEKGLLQEIRRRPGAVGTEIRCQLDNWQIAAIDHLIVLQRPGEVPVTLVADGEAFWSAEGGGERREPRLQFRFDR